MNPLLLGVLLIVIASSSIGSVSEHDRPISYERFSVGSYPPLLPASTTPCGLRWVHGRGWVLSPAALDKIGQLILRLSDSTNLLFQN